MGHKRQMADALVQSFGPRGEQMPFTRILRRVDTMLAKYTRAQLALAGLSFVFYTVSLLLLGFPYAIALGLRGGALEFLPAVGWITSATVMLTIGFLTHAHWISMAGLVVLWRLAQNYVLSPRIMGNTLELRPLTVLFALMVGGQLVRHCRVVPRCRQPPCCESSGWSISRVGTLRIPSPISRSCKPRHEFCDVP